MIAPAVSDCPVCPETIARVQVERVAVVCPGCGDELAPAAPHPVSAAGASRGPRLVVCPGELDAGPVIALGLDRAAREAARPRGEDPELVRVRSFVFSLRPDAPDPLQPPPVERTETPAPYLRTGDGAPPWDRLPRGLGSSTPAADPGTDRREHVLAAIAALPPDAAAVCRWLRASATFAQGLRGLYVDAGLAFASEDQRTAWVDLTARRLGAASHGRALVLAAERAWREAP